MPQIESVPATYKPAETDLCFSPEGWRLGVAFKVLLQLQGGMNLEEALHLLWQQHGGLLGYGTLCIKMVEPGPPAKGYIVFTPDDSELSEA